jgi:molecular chaperone IbpA
MSNVRIPQFLSKNLLPQTIGFDDFFTAIDKIVEPAKSFPPYDIIKVSENEWTLNVAAAGFTKDQLSVDLGNNQLRVMGNQVENLTEEYVATEYIYKGISARKFTRLWTVAEGTKVASASYENGILSINLQREVVEKQPTKIAIK